MPRLLELFSGTGSFGKNFKGNVVSLDIHPKYNPTHCVDVLTWNYKQYPPGYFNIIHASPPCTEYSIAKTTAPRNLKLADAIVRRVLKIIAYFKPRYFFIENPVGLMRHRPCMQNMEKYRHTCSYCRYGKPYRKNTDIWTNKPVKLKRCTHETPCKWVKKYGKHPHIAQAGPNMNDLSQKATPEVDKLYTIPNKLIKYLLTC
tara:strand:+ start:406 stop:1011 length:606 start_codon:yes stop_codon:yes gene_type:complete